VGTEIGSVLRDVEVITIARAILARSRSMFFLILLYYDLSIFPTIHCTPAPQTFHGKLAEQSPGLVGRLDVGFREAVPPCQYCAEWSAVSFGWPFGCSVASLGCFLVQRCALNRTRVASM
jgi:hypothetical protein